MNTLKQYIPAIFMAIGAMVGAACSGQDPLHTALIGVTVFSAVSWGLLMAYGMPRR